MILSHESHNEHGTRGSRSFTSFRMTLVGWYVLSSRLSARLILYAVKDDTGEWVGWCRVLGWFLCGKECYGSELELFQPGHAGQQAFGAVHFEHYG
jgi:hypothetical protein